MIPIDQLERYIQQLPAPLQAEVLDFVEYLLTKVERETAQQTADWSAMSLAAAMRGMEYEETPAYTPADLKVLFS